MSARLKVLFVCGRNLRRSPTAERIYRNDPRVEVRSAGVSKESRKKLSSSDLEWADLVLVMERRYAKRIQEQFRELRHSPQILSLDIPDEFNFMDNDLIELIKDSSEPFISQFPAG